MRYFLSCLSLVLLYATALHAQAGVGTIQGKILDEAGEPLRKASVFVENTKRGAYSDVKGSYSIKNVPAGKYSLRFSYIGYNTKIIENVEVKEGQTIVVNTVLKTETTTTKDVVVTATRDKGAQEAVLTERKNAAQVSDGVSRDDISRLPDADAGQALKRVSGVTLVNDKFVYVRGASERYSNTTLNGLALSSTEPDKKAFAFDMFPSEFLENANITKSFTPDLPGNFAGGLVQLNTVDFPQSFGVRFSASSTVNDNVTFKSNAFSSYPGGSDDWLGMDDGSRAMPAAANISRTELYALRQAARDEFDTTGAAERYNAIGRSFNDKVWERRKLTPNPNTSLGLSYSNIFSIAENDFGVIASANYGSSYSINNIERNGILGTGEKLFVLNGTQSTYSAGWSGLLNLAYKLGTHSSISFKNIYNRSSDDETTIQSGSDLGDRKGDIEVYSAQYVEKTLYSTQVAGEHSLPIQDMYLDWRFGYSESERDQPDYRRLKYWRTLGDTASDYVADFLYAGTQGDGATGGRFFSNLKDYARTGSINLTIPVSDVKFKLGALMENRNRGFNARSFTIIKNTDSPDSIDFSAAPAELLAASNFRMNGLGILEDSKLSDAYTAHEELIASYLMLDLPFSIAEQNFRFIGGARLENSVQALQSFDINNIPVHPVLQTSDVLPSINLIYKVTEDMNLRMSASQTLTRPTLRELAPFEFLAGDDQTITGGNPNLKRALIQNYDMRLEIFPNAGEVLSVSGFYKTFENAIEETIRPRSGRPSITFQNADGIATNYGVELEARKSLSFIGSYFGNFVMNVNYAWINSQLTVKQGNVSDTRPMWGQSPYTFNIGLYFAEPDWKTAVNLAYNIIGKRIIRVGAVSEAGKPQYEFTNDPHVYELPRSVIDLTIIQPVWNAFEAKLAIRDLLNQPLQWEQGGIQVASNLRGRSFSLSLGYKVQ